MTDSDVLNIVFTCIIIFNIYTLAFVVNSVFYNKRAISFLSKIAQILNSQECFNVEYTKLVKNVIPVFNEIRKIINSDIWLCVTALCINGIGFKLSTVPDFQITTAWTIIYSFSAIITAYLFISNAAMKSINRDTDTICNYYDKIVREPK